MRIINSPGLLRSLSFRKKKPARILKKNSLLSKFLDLEAVRFRRKGIVGKLYSTYFLKREYFNKKNFVVIIMLTSFLISFISPKALIIFSTIVTFYVYLFLKTKKIAKGIYVSRNIPDTVYEKDKITISYKIENSSPFNASDLMLTDYFSGAREPDSLLLFNGILKSETDVKKTNQKYCDAGMGLHSFGPLSVTVTDSLGIFSFIITEDEIIGLDIFPRIEPIPDLKIQPSPQSLQIGVYDIHSSSQSSNFMGLRDYTPGDPLKYISWRMSAKHFKLIVKEFEKATNADVTIILNMDEADHMGTWYDSTWEAAKDMVISISSQQIEIGNRVSLISENLYLPPGTSKEYLSSLILALFKMLPQKSKKDLIKLSYHLIADGATVYYITPLYQQDVNSIRSKLKQIRSKNINLICIFIDAYSFIEEEVKNNPDMFIETCKERPAPSLLFENDMIKGIITQEGSSTYIIRKGTDVGKALLS